MVNRSEQSSFGDRVMFSDLVMSLWSNDLDELAVAVRNWDLELRQLGRGAFTGKLDMVHLEGVQLFHTFLSHSIQGRGNSPQGTVALGVPITLNGRTVWHGNECDLNHIMVNVSGDVDYQTTNEAELAVLTFRLDWLLERAIRDYGWDIKPALQSNGLIKAQPDKLNLLRTFVMEVIQQMQRVPNSLSQPQESSRAMEKITHLVLESMRVEEVEHTNGKVPRRFRLVHEAEDYMMQHIREPLSLQTICTAVGVSKRTLNYAFQERFNMSPIAYLKIQRLNQVRGHLKAADPKSANVSTIAQQSGFRQMGHFAVDYKAMFGESPSDTLQNT